MFRREFQAEFWAMFVIQVCVSIMGFDLSLMFRAWVVVNLWVSASQFVFLIWVVNLLVFLLVFLLSFLFFFTGF